MIGLEQDFLRKWKGSLINTGTCCNAVIYQSKVNNLLILCESSFSIDHLTIMIRQSIEDGEKVKDELVLEQDDFYLNEVCLIINY